MASIIKVDTIKDTSDNTLLSTSSGNVHITNSLGINQSSPSAKLDITATAATSGEDLIKLSNGADACELVIDTSANAINFKTGTGDDLVFLPAGTEAVRINDAGNVSIFGVVAIETANNIPLQIESTDAFCALSLADTGGSSKIETASGALIFETGGDASTPSTNSVEAMRINSSGNLIVGDTTATANNPKIDAIGGATEVAFTGYRKTSTVAATVVNFRSDVGSTGALIAEIEANGDVVTESGSFTAFSDINLKQDIVDAQSQWEDIKSLQVRNFKLKKLVNAYGEDAPTYLGLIAQEVEASGMNGLVSENEEGTKYVKYSILYMKAVKALQEAMERIETLEAKVQALENA